MAMAAQFPDTCAHRGAVETQRGAAESKDLQMALATRHPDAGTRGCAITSQATTAIERTAAARRHRAISRRDATLETITPRPTHK